MDCAELYLKQWLQLLPPGKAWPKDEDSDLYKLLQGFSDSSAQLCEDVATFIDDVYPDTTTAFLEDWERIVGIPDECAGGEVAGTIEQRRLDVLAKLRARGVVSVQDFKDLAETLGLDSTNITVQGAVPFTTCSTACDPLNEADCVYVVVFTIPGSPNDTRFECMVRKLIQAHRFPLFEYLP